MSEQKYAVRVLSEQPCERDLYTTFLKAAYPDDPLYWDLERWRWQYLDNPTDGGCRPPIWIFTDGNRILAQVGTIPIHLKVNGHSYLAAWCSDFVVLPEFRNRGVGPLLLKAVKEKFDFLMALGISDMSYPLFKKDRWEDLGTLPHYIKILDFKGIATRFFKNEAMQMILTVPGNCLLRVLSFIERREDKDISLSRIEHFDPESDKLWARIAEKFQCIVQRDYHYLNWKYFSQPRMHYVAYRADREGVLRGYVIVRKNRANGLLYGIISDLLADPDDVATVSSLLMKAIDYFRSEGVALIRSYATDVRYQKILRRYGFLKKRSYVRFMFTTSVASTERIGASSLTNWFIMKGDSDLDRIPHEELA